MDRPSSRGGPISLLNHTGLGKAPVGSLLAQPERPMTGMRGAAGAPPGTASGRPPGTASRGPAGGLAGPPPGTAYKRMGTAAGRPGTGQQGNVAGMRTGTSVQVENRPITQHGVVGMKAVSGGGGGRKVLDRNYFLNELRQKRLEVAQITQQMKSELEALEKKQAQYGTMEAHCSKLIKEVKTQQEQLADFNTVLDKVGSQTPTYIIQQEQVVLRDRNEAARKRVDDVLTQRLALEDKARKAEGKILELQQSMDARLASMPPSQRQQYNDLMGEQQSLSIEAKRYEEACDELDRQLAIQEGELARNPLKQRSLLLQEQIRQLTEKKWEAAQDEERSKASPGEQREQLLAKIKRDNQEVEQITASIKEVQEQVKRSEARLATLSGTSGQQFNAAEEQAKREKFDELVAKERDLANFMDSFPSRRAAKQQELRDRQDAIVAVLDKLSKLATLSEGVLPTRGKFREMQDELEYKQQQLENTQVTQERLQEELVLRRTELDKIDTLEDKIKSELQQLDEKMETMKKDLDTFSQVGDMAAKAEEARTKLEALRSDLLSRKDLLRATAAEKGLKQQAKAAQLQENNLQVAVTKLEQKLRSLNTGIYDMTEVVRAKESETNYKVLAHAIGQLVEEINTGVQKSVALL